MLLRGGFQARLPSSILMREQLNHENLRVIETQINPIYKAKNDTVELNADYNVTPEFTLTSQTGYNQDFL